MQFLILLNFNSICLDINSYLYDDKVVKNVQFPCSLYAKCSLLPSKKKSSGMFFAYGNSGIQ